jgi:hypothetical protein
MATEQTVTKKSATPAAVVAKGTRVDVTATPLVIQSAQQIPVKDLVLLDNPGRMEGDNKLEMLRHAIEQAGQVLQALTIRPTTEEDGEHFAEGKFAIVDGRRRFRCAKSLGFKTVPVILWNPGKGKDRITTVQGAILANLANRSLTAPEMLNAFLALADDLDWDVKVPKAGEKGVGACGKDVEKLARYTETSKATIYRTLRMGLLDKDILKKVHNKEVGADAARDMGGLAASGFLTEDQIKLVFEEAFDANAKKKIDNKRDPNAPDTRTPDQIRLDNLERKRKLAKKRAAKASENGEGGAEVEEVEEVIAVSKGDLKKAAIKLEKEGKLSSKAAAAVAEAAGKGAGISADAKSMTLKLKHLDDLCEELINDENPHIAKLGAAMSKFMDGSLVMPEVVKQFEKHCLPADDVE